MSCKAGDGCSTIASGFDLCDTENLHHVGALQTSFLRAGASRSPPAWEGLQDTDFAEVSQRVRWLFYNRIAGCTAHPRSALDWQELFYVGAALVGCGHVSGLLMRHGWPLALMLCADQVPILRTHSKMR